MNSKNAPSQDLWAKEKPQHFRATGGLFVCVCGTDSKESQDKSETVSLASNASLPSPALGRGF